MDFRNIVGQAIEFLVFVATTNPYAVPFWMAVACFIVLLNWKMLVRLIWRSLHLIEDLVLQRQLFSKIEAPLRFLLCLVAMVPFLHFLPKEVGGEIVKATNFAIPLLALYVLVQFFDTLFFTWYLQQRRDANVPTVMRFVVLAGVYFVFGLAFLEWTLGINVLPLLATSTVVTAVLGLSLQDTLKNMFAGLTMSFEKRFSQGDWIQFRLDQTNTTIGEVIEIGWRTTQIKTIDNNFAVIPNALFTSNQLINYSQPTPEFPKQVEIPIRSGVPMEKVTSILMDAANKTPGVLTKPEPDVLFIGIRTDHVVFRVRFWTANYTESDNVASKLIEHAYKALSALHAVPALGELPSVR